MQVSSVLKAVVTHPLSNSFVEEKRPRTAEFCRDASISGMTDKSVYPQIVTSNFKLVFISILLITVASGIGDAVLASMWQNPTGNQQSTFEAFGFAWKAGLGAIFGLLGGKVA